MNVFNENNKNKEKELFDNGYVIIDLLDQKEIDLLNDYFYNQKNVEYKKAYTTFSVNDVDYKREVDLFIKSVIDNKTQKFLNKEIISFWGNYMLKVPSPETNMPLHTDWQYVDEEKYISLNLWCPLIDTDENNGGLQVVPQSHKVIDFPRGVGLPRYYEQNEKLIKQKYGKLLKLKKGQAVIYDHRLLHYSLPNESTSDRLAITLIYLHKEADKFIFYNKDNVTNRYTIEDVNSLISIDYFDEVKDFKSKKIVDVPKYEAVNILKKMNSLHVHPIVNWFYSKIY